MDHFSWSDGVQAVLAPCLACLPSRRYHSHPESSTQGAGPDLQRLLAEPGDSTDTEAETLSLHSTVGHEQRRKKKKKKKRNPKRITLWGWDLFGRPAIQLPPDEDDDDGEQGEGRRGRPRLSSRASVDSDAAPIDPSTIAQLSSSPPAPRGQPSEHARMRVEPEEDRVAREQEREREERRRRRRERRAMKELALRLAAGHGADDGEFEGFQGSGSGVGGAGGIPSPFKRGALPVSPSVTGSDSQLSYQQRAPQQQQQQLAPHPDVDEPLEGDADFGAESYAKRGGAAGTSDGGGSDSRSRTSGSRSNSGYAPYPADATQSAGVGAEYNHHFLSSQPPAQAQKKSKKKKSRKSGIASNSNSSHSRSDSRSVVLSPSTPAFEGYPAEDDTFEGYPVDDTPVKTKAPSVASATTTTSFPSSGFGGSRRGKSDAGVFLARRGDD
ncbi:hypothetical protein PUNSTDRAFT_126189 [Punctularia strigosozonata HHB-11173 SS5]|uniref:uncharacterized protein n=1 Tax=Punctularia strigosozonata (strain HHB-11173) TaxID=741275 RepID=UPI00044178AD|nr:uncharacterized protein PUNSTDRAFT_126189 [Punctularia strigosozonata HHB-11173 SS5]EIN09040.1 hypothetical protein PUNSTDRAFT_126189 [Punctularia strigosozonata HHB-11173 SS5]